MVGAVGGRGRTPLALAVEAAFREPELVGYSSQTFECRQGLLALNRACDASFPGSRMCAGEDIARTSPVPAGLSGSAWVLLDILQPVRAFIDEDGLIDGSCGIKDPDHVPTDPNDIVIIPNVFPVACCR